MRRYWNQCLVSLTIGTAMSLPSPGVKFTGINLAWEITGNHTSCCMKLVRTIVVTKSTQLDSASGWARIAPREWGCRMEFGSEFRLGKKLHSVPKIVEDQMELPALTWVRIIHVWFSILIIKCSLGEQTRMWAWFFPTLPRTIQVQKNCLCVWICM